MTMTATATDLAQQYQKKTDKQHIMDNPDTYIGSVETVDANLWIAASVASSVASSVAPSADAPSGNAPTSVAPSVASSSVTAIECMTMKNVEYVPGLYKLFDEGIVNCRDHVVRMAAQTGDTHKPVTAIAVTCDPVTGTITMENDGNGIDVVKHPEYDLWIPEMIFGHLRTSTNYNTQEKRIVGGKNGFGFKLVLIWSTGGSVETVDHVRGLKYEQSFGPHLDTMSTPVITKVKGKAARPYTKVTFTPDYARLGVPLPLPDDTVALFRKRVYDISAVTDAKIKVSYNGALVPVKNFQQYVEMYVGKEKKAYESAGNGRWEYCVALSPTQQFEQVSFVNGICTFKGGKHVDYVMGQICRKLAALIEKKKKVTVNPATIREQLILFLRADIENPAFDSQTKDYMNTPSAKFGSTCNVSDAFIEKVAKMGVMDAACSLTALKDRNSAKKSDGTKTRTVRGIANFIDANWAGTAQSRGCTLILCEGLSAMSGVVSGLTSEDRNRYGIYPLKGKLLNVRGEAIKKISENKEISDLKKILGLETSKTYATAEDVAKHLRYSKIMILTDADVDGSHIKALCVNLFQSEWASLFKINGFLSFMNTPILRAKKGQQTLLFYNQGEFETWCQTHDVQGWHMKYFKGLGTSTAKEFREYFASPRFVDFQYTGDDSDEVVDKVFNKARANERKTWLENYDKRAYLNTSTPTVSYKDFVDKELIHFSIYDCERSIPNMVDGLKTSQRKILHCAFKRRLTQELKVAQFAAAVAESTLYHHGEKSLNDAIVGMAQNYVGSNNLNLLAPEGQFGSRLHGGDDSASERYIFTRLESVTRTLFPDADDSILHHLEEEGHIIEPEYFVPILPVVLCNGISGIGTGFSSSIPPFHPTQIVKYLKNKLGVATDVGTFVPYYEGFKGTVVPIDSDPKKCAIKGTFMRLSPAQVRITELPVGTWTMPYITGVLDTLVDGSTDKQGKKIAPILKEFTNNSTEKRIDITVTFVQAVSDEEVDKMLKLSTSVSVTNMHLFDKCCKLHKYQAVEEIIDAFYEVRYEAYGKRKAHQIQALEAVFVKLSHKVKYIQAVLSNAIDLRHKSGDEIGAMLERAGLVKIETSYDYLVKMPMVSVSKEHVEKLTKECAQCQHELNELRKMSVERMWLLELDAFEHAYEGYVTKRRAEYVVAETKKPAARKQK